MSEPQKQQQSPVSLNDQKEDQPASPSAAQRPTFHPESRRIVLSETLKLSGLDNGYQWTTVTRLEPSVADSSRDVE